MGFSTNADQSRHAGGGRESYAPSQKRKTLSFAKLFWFGIGVGGFVAPASATLDQTDLGKMLQVRAMLLDQTDATPFLKNPWEGMESRPAIALSTDPQPRSTSPYQYITPTGPGWKKEIMTTVFWIGEDPAKNNPVPNNKSSWDTKWEENFGGYDCPTNRIGYRPAGFIPQQNPFYIALPYNDVGRDGTKAEASQVIPWFSRDFVRSGKSVVKGRWLAIHYKGRVAYAQWEDTGPFRTDHWQYVFGKERPSQNRNKAAGLDVSPAVRDYLGLNGNDNTDWKFVEAWEVPKGPWTKYGANNPFSPQYTPDKEKQALAAQTNPNINPKTR